MTSLLGLVPTLLLIVSAALPWFNPSPWSVLGFLVAAALWGFERFLTVKPKEIDDSRLVAMETKLADTVKMVDSLKTAFNLKQLR